MDNTKKVDKKLKIEKPKDNHHIPILSSEIEPQYILPQKLLDIATTLGLYKE